MSKGIIGETNFISAFHVHKFSFLPLYKVFKKHDSITNDHNFIVKYERKKQFKHNTEGRS